MIYRLRSADVVIDRVMTMFRLNTSDWLADAFEYMGDAIEMIGTTAPLVKTSKKLTVGSHRVKIPCELTVLFAVEYKGRRLRLGGDQTGYGVVEEERTTKIYTLSPSFDSGGLIYYDGTPAEFERALLSEDSEYYQINPNYIQTSFEEGEIKLHYGSYPVDKNGYPLIPDNVWYRRALEWYLMAQLILSGYKHPEINYQMADAKFEEALPKAQNSMVMVDIGGMDRFANMWARLVPPQQLPQNFFAGAESQDRIAGI